MGVLTTAKLTAACALIAAMLMPHGLSGSPSAWGTRPSPLMLPGPTAAKWDRVPYFVQCGNASGPVSEAVLALQAGASFTVVDIQQGMESEGFVCSVETDPAACNSTGAESRMAEAAARIRAVNPEAKAVFYYTCDNVRMESDLGRWFVEEHPELLLRRYAVDRRSGRLGPFQMYQYDWSNPATVQAWAKGIATAVKKGKFDGVFIDGYEGWHGCRPGSEAEDISISKVGHLSGCPSLLSGIRTAVGNRTINTTAYLQNLWYETGPALAKLLDPGAILIPNCEHGYGCRDGNGSSRIPGYTGVMEEFFGEVGILPNQTDATDGKQPGDDEGIASLAKLAGRGTFSEINWTDEKDQDHAVLALAAFLSGAGENQYFGVIGWHWNCAEIPIGTLKQLYRRPLGKPIGPAKVMVSQLVDGKSGQYVVSYERSFSKKTRVFLNATHNMQHPPPPSCCILWGDGSNSTCNPGDCDGKSI